MADDLDDFFNDIEEAEAEAVKEVEEEKPGSEPSLDNEAQQSTHSPSSTDSTTAKAASEGEPPKKRAKVVAAAAAPVRPRGVVVAASSSVVTNKPVATTTSSTTEPTSFHNQSGPSVGVGPGTTPAYLPPLPPGPLPPPPPPPLPPPASGSAGHGDPSIGATNQTNKKPVKRVAAGKVWVDPTLAEWPENDFRIFVGNLSRDVTDQQLQEHFQQRYASCAMAKVVKDKAGVSKGYGFVSFLQPLDCAKAIREQDQKWLGSRPIRVKRSDWKDRNFNNVEKKKKKEAKKERRLGGL